MYMYGFTIIKKCGVLHIYYNGEKQKEFPMQDGDILELNIK
jgi:hypothetical protein